MSVFTLGDKHPQLAADAWIAPNATVIGDVRLGAGASIWWNAVLRGETSTTGRLPVELPGLFPIGSGLTR